MNPTCLCSHPRAEHDTGNGGEECRRDLHPACYCDEYRLDHRSRLRDEPGEAEDAATAEGAA